MPYKWDPLNDSKLIILWRFQARINHPEKNTDTQSKVTQMELRPVDLIHDRVGAFEKNAQEMVQRLLRVYVHLLGCTDDQQVEDLKMDVAPDAASLISQGDTIVFEATGMPELLSQRMLDIQRELREKFKRVQNFRLDI